MKSSSPASAKILAINEIVEGDLLPCVDFVQVIARPPLRVEP